MRKKLGSKKKKKTRADSWAIGQFCDWPTFGMIARILPKHFPRLMPSIHVLYCWCGFKFVSTRLLAVMPGPPFHLQFASGRSHKSWLCQNALKYHRSAQICSSRTEAKSFQDAQSLLLDEVNLSARPKRQTQNSWVWHIKLPKSHFSQVADMKCSCGEVEWGLADDLQAWEDSWKGTLSLEAWMCRSEI